MLDLSDQGEVIDHITLTEHLKIKSELEAVGGSAYLAELLQAVPTAANIKYHCRIVRDKALLRGLITTSTDIISRGYDEAAPVDDLLDFAERSVFSLAQGKLGRSFIRVKEIIKESLDYVDILSKRDHNTVTGIATGYVEIDEITAGLHRPISLSLRRAPAWGRPVLPSEWRSMRRSSTVMSSASSALKCPKRSLFFGC
jgi:Replicative DNA helicase